MAGPASRKELSHERIVALIKEKREVAKETQRHMSSPIHKETTNRATPETGLVI